MRTGCAPRGLTPAATIHSVRRSLLFRRRRNGCFNRRCSAPVLTERPAAAADDTQRTAAGLQTAAPPRAGGETRAAGPGPGPGLRPGLGLVRPMRGGWTGPGPPVDGPP
ncbi:unnamed protein product [Merluccius merluccius]